MYVCVYMCIYIYIYIVLALRLEDVGRRLALGLADLREEGGEPEEDYNNFNKSSNNHNISMINTDDRVLVIILLNYNISLLLSLLLVAPQSGRHYPSKASRRIRPPLRSEALIV